MISPRRHRTSNPISITDIKKPETAAGGRLVLALLLLILLAGCGPVFTPMMPRLDPATQNQVDRMWNNMLTPVNHVDRQALLDANVAFWMYTIGVDRLHMTSEKYFTGGKVIMQIDCDRATPNADQYTITVLDPQGRTLRRERYSRGDVEESARMLMNQPPIATTEPWSPNLLITVNQITTQPTTEAVTQPASQWITTQPLTPEEQANLREYERRRNAAVAATQPATPDQGRGANR
jgi:hypothetical protein